MEQKTHRVVVDPRMAVRYLADYMAAGGQKRRTILRDCKYPRIARVVQHDEAKETIGEFIRGGCSDPLLLLQKAEALKNAPAADDFERQVLDINADYMLRFFQVYQLVALPTAEVLPPKQYAPMVIHGVKVPFSPAVVFRRLTSTNKVKMGALMLRYAKGRSLKPEVASFQSAIIFGYVKEHLAKDGADADLSLCITVDCHSGSAYPAPGNSITRFKNTKAECATIGEAWPAISPPPGAVV